MVSRIENKTSEGEWEFFRNVMPGQVAVMTDILPDGKEEHLAVLCTIADDVTAIIRMSGEEYERGQEGECFLMPERPMDVVLRLGDYHYLTSIQPENKIDRAEIRIFHHDKY